MKTTDFISKWEDFRTQKGYMQRLDPSHPLDFFIGINEKGYDELALITVIEPCQMKSSKALEVEKNKRKDGKWATQIASVESKNQEIFARLCVDLVESSYTANSEQEGISRVAARFLAWQRLFATMHETLPLSVLKGLVGELKFAQYLLDKGVSKDDLIQSWQGPSGADRDYVLNDKWYEIKAISTGKDKVTISSLNQLETDIPGCLVIINVDESSNICRSLYMQKIFPMEKRGVQSLKKRLDYHRIGMKKNCYFHFRVLRSFAEVMFIQNNLMLFQNALFA